MDNKNAKPSHDDVSTLTMCGNKCQGSSSRRDELRGAAWLSGLMKGAMPVEIHVPLLCVRRRAIAPILTSLDVWLRECVRVNLPG